MLVSGLVQGVGFRWYTAQRARTVGVAGSVRNLPDGRVEAVFEGPEQHVESMVAWCRTGPRGARVRALEVIGETPAGLTSFDIGF